jgi:hypothetical protein
MSLDGVLIAVIVGGIGGMRFRAARSDSSELKLRGFLFGNCPIHRLNLALDPRNLITGQ